MIQEVRAQLEQAARVGAVLSDLQIETPDGHVLSERELVAAIRELEFAIELPDHPELGPDDGTHLSYLRAIRFRRVNGQRTLVSVPALILAHQGQGWPAFEAVYATLEE